MPTLEDSYNGYGSGASKILGGLFSNSEKPYQKAGNTLQDFLGQAKSYQNPFFNAGTDALPNLQDWLGKMKNPEEFINKLLGSYQQSPFAKNAITNANREGTNYGSASGLIGSTPLLRQMQQNSNEIGESDIKDWLSQVLGINTQYGKGEQDLVTGGESAANNISELLKQLGIDIAGANYGAENAHNNNRNNLFKGVFDTGSKLFTHFFK